MTTCKNECVADRYELIRLIGRGGMGEVFLAHDRATGNECALKRLRADSVSDRNELSREFAHLTRVRHPAIVRVLDLGYEADGSAWYTMEYVAGEPSSTISAGAGDALAFLAAEVTSGLEALHAAQIVHGDLKPSNLLVIPSLQDGGRAARDRRPAGVRIVDFGLAERIGERGRRHVGTAGFAAPEVVNGASPTPGSDLYSLGASLYHLVAGHPAFQGSDTTERLRRQREGPPPARPLEESGAPAGLVSLIMRLMAEAPTDRPRDAREARLELAQILPGARRPLCERLATFVLVGRERDLSRLNAWAASRSQPMLVVTAEPGMGRTSLIHAFAARCALAKRPMLHLQGGDGGHAAGFVGILLRQLAALAHVGPDELARIETAAADLAGDDESALDRAADLGIAFSRAAGEDGQTVIALIDDSERLEPLARAFLRRLAVQEPPAVRWVQLRPAAHPLGDDEEPMRVAGRLGVLRIGPLDRDGIDQLVSTRLGGPAPEGLIEHLYSAASGHPGLTLELLRAAARESALVEGDEGVSIEAARLAALEIGSDFRAALLGRLEASSSPARSAALALAVLGGTARRSELDRLVGDDAIPGIEALVEIGWAHADPEGRIVLSYPALSKTLIDRAPTDRVRELHRMALDLEVEPEARFAHWVGMGEREEALRLAEGEWREAPDRAPAAAAAAIAEASGAAEAVTWHDRAASQAWRRSRYGAAVRHLERSIALAGHAAGAERWERLAAARFRVGSVGEVGQALEAGFAADPSEGVRGRLLGTEAARRYASGELDASLDVAREALRVSARTGDAESEAHIALTAGSVLLALGRTDEAEAMADRAASRYQESGQEVGQSRAEQLRALVLRRTGRWTEALEAYRTALARAQTSGSRLAIEECHFKLAQLFGDLGRGQECRDSYRAALRIALEDGRGRGVAQATLNLAQYEGLSGRPSEAVRLARRAIRLARTYLPSHEFFGWRSLAQGLRALGRLIEAERAAKRALRLAHQHAGAEDLVWCRVELCRALFERGRHEEAVAAAQETADPTAWTQGDVVLVLCAARAALHHGDRQRAASALKRATAWLGKSPAPYGDAIASQLRAELSLVEGRVAEATQRLEASLTAFETIPARHDRAMALLDFARLAALPKADHRAQVSDWLRQAVTLFARLGDRRRRRQAVELEADWLRRQLEHAQWDQDRSLIEKVGQLLHSLANRRDLAQQAMQLAVEQFNAERGVLLIEDEVTHVLEPVAECGAADATSQREALHFSRQLVQRVVKEGAGILVYDAPNDPDAASESVEELRLRALLCVPMFLHGRVMGAVYLDSRRPGAFRDSDRRLLEGFAMMMAEVFESSRATEELAHENFALRQDMTARARAGLIGSSRALQRVIPHIERASRSNVTVLLTGETGTGKDLVARVIHQSSSRAKRPFVSANCGAFEKTLLSSELFGIRDGAATGVTEGKGRFRAAQGGTLFLDEIAELPLEQQATLLSAVEKREVTPVGEHIPVPVDIRIIAATNRDLRALIDQGTFRKDLFFRLDVFRIELPPLRERKGDIPELARHFASQFAARDHRPVPELAPDFLADLMQRDWPGNVRELENYVERVMTMREGDVLHAEMLDEDWHRSRRNPLPGNRSFADQVNALERRLLTEALRRCGGVQSRAAQELGLTESTLRNKLAKHGIGSSRKLRIL